MSRFYTNSPYTDKSPSVTTILQVLNKQWLTAWAAKAEREMCADSAWVAYSGLRKFENRDDILAYFGETSQAFKQISKDAMDKGSLVHNMISPYYELSPVIEPSDPAISSIYTPQELYMMFLGDYYPEDCIKMLSAFFKCLKENHLEVLVSEHTVHHPTGFSGTLDAIVRDIDSREIFIADWKTGDPERIGPPAVPRFEHRLQTEAYRQCAVYDGSRPSGRMVVYLRKDQHAGKYCLWKSTDIEHQIKDWDAFKACKLLWEAQNG